MEHRWGERQRVNIPVKLHQARSSVAFNGRLINLSMSGALVIADVSVRLLSRIHLTFLMDYAEHGPHRIAAYVARKHSSVFGVEWCESTSPALNTLLKAALLVQEFRPAPITPAFLDRVA